MTCPSCGCPNVYENANGQQCNRCDWWRYHAHISESFSDFAALRGQARRELPEVKLTRWDRVRLWFKRLWLTRR